MPDAAELLKQDHRQVERLFERYQGGDRQVVKQICDELTVHTAIEEERVYPVLAQISGGSELRQESEREHQEVKAAISRVEQAGSHEDIEQPMQAIIEGVNRHVQEEENMVLPKMAEELGAARMLSLGEQLEDARRQRQGADGRDGSDGWHRDLDDLSKGELYVRAQAANVTGRSHMTKNQLKEALRS